MIQIICGNNSHYELCTQQFVYYAMLDLFMSACKLVQSYFSHYFVHSLGAYGSKPGGAKLPYGKKENVKVANNGVSIIHTLT